MYDILFFILALLAVAGAVGMISMVQPIFSAISFIVTLIALAGIFALLDSSFLFAIQIIIYAGAIVSLILFIIMFLNIQPKNLPAEPHKNRWIFFTALAVTPFGYLLVTTLKKLPLPKDHPEGFGTIKSVGHTLFSDFVLPFEMISILLIISLIGAVVLAQKKQEGEDAL